MSPRLLGQTSSIGFIGGGSLTDAIQTETAYNTRWWSQSKDWIAGAMVEFRFHSPFSVEVDGMYRELHATWAGIEPDGSLNSVSPSPVVTWEFPVLAKYRFGAATLKPFVEAGPSFRTTGNLNFTPSHYGVTAGLGVETRWRGLNIAPVVRYTHWAPDLNYASGSQLSQLELVVGISHAPESQWSPLGRRMSLGAVAGWGLTNDISAYTNDAVVPVLAPGNTYTQANATDSVTGVKSLVIGPAVEVDLPRHFSVELDALYKPLRDHYKTVLDSGTVYVSATYTEATTWQFPVFAKYRFRLIKVHSFVEAGPSFRLPEENLSTHGVTAGAGVEMRLRALRISPVLRFTHWSPETGYGLSGVARNEASLLVGFSFGGTRYL